MCKKPNNIAWIKDLDIFQGFNFYRNWDVQELAMDIFKRGGGDAFQEK